MVLSEFNIVYMTQKLIKAEALDDHLAENLINEEYNRSRHIFMMKRYRL